LYFCLTNVEASKSALLTEVKMINFRKPRGCDSERISTNDQQNQSANEGVTPNSDATKKKVTSAKKDLASAHE
jgi:hypothetical protein